MRIGFAPTSRDFAHLAAANGLEPIIRWTWEVESMAVRREIIAIFGASAELDIFDNGGARL